MLKEIGTGLAIAPSGRRVPIGFYELDNGRVKAYRRSASGQYSNWEITMGWNFSNIEHAVEIITNKGWSVEIDE